MRDAMNTERLENGAATERGPGAGRGVGRISPDRGRVFAGCGPGSTVDGCAEGIWLDDGMTGRQHTMEREFLLVARRNQRVFLVKPLVLCASISPQVFLDVQARRAKYAGRTPTQSELNADS
jgi:hypothetical protein